MKNLLLLGAGHAHAQVLRAWARQPGWLAAAAGVKLTIVSPNALAPYSGMVPGWLAGHYSFEDIGIDFRPLAAAAGAQLLIDEVQHIDAGAHQVRLASGATLAWDVLSLNIGSTLLPPAGLPGSVLALRPLGRLHSAWQAVLQQQAARRRPLRVTAVGGGAAGFECLLAVLARLRAQQPGRSIDGQLYTRGELLPGLAPGAVKAAHQALKAAGAQLHTGTDFEARHAGADDLLLWATGAQAHPFQRASGLATSASGYFQVDAQLQSRSHPSVFAVGDCAEASPPLPKAGVYAVRMGPVLTANLQAAVTGAALVPYRPQQRHLALLATADGRAIASRGAWSLHGPWLGRWAWRWKDHIDRGFVAGFGGGR